MGRIAFVFLMFLTLCFDSALQLHGQEEVATGPVTPTIRAPDPSDPSDPGVQPASSLAKSEVGDAAAELGAKNATNEAATSLARPKKPQNIWEELVANPLNYLLLLLVCVYVYLMFLQPKAGRKEQREQVERLKNLKKNDRVVTISGIHGIVSNINTEAGTITLRVDENSNAKLTIDRMSIRTVLS
jgi:preprotein translocase subunit YajC